MGVAKEVEIVGKEKGAMDLVLPFGRKPWYQQKWAPPLITALVPVATLVVSASTAATVPLQVVYFSVAALPIIGAWWTYLVNRPEASRYHQDALQMACRLLRDALIEELDPPLKDAEFRRAVSITAYGVPRKGRGDMVQLIDEIGGEGVEAGRRIPLGMGAIGHAATSKEVIIGYRTSNDIEAFRKDLSRTYGMSADVCKMVRADMWAWCAIPIVVDEVTLAVVFVDSTVSAIFAPNGSEPARAVQRLERLVHAMERHFKGVETD